MPVLDGFSAIRALKAVPETRSIPAIAITAMAMGGDQERLLAAGFDGYLSKPIDAEEIRLRVKNAVLAKHLYDQVQETLKELDRQG